MFYTNTKHQLKGKTGYSFVYFVTFFFPGRRIEKKGSPLIKHILFQPFFFFFFFFSFRDLQLMLPEAPQPYGLLYSPRIGHYNFLHQFRSATPPEQRKLEL
jgi:hypothetical protein